jgi:hypothetical protein
MTIEWPNGRTVKEYNREERQKKMVDRGMEE